ncbi:MAG: cupin domain-containing protein [Desulfovibrionaceae bacterium]
MQPKRIHYKDVLPEIMGEQHGAKDIAMRTVIGPQDGAPNFHMRILTFGPGGHSPSHSHPWEHENFVVSGNGELEVDGTVYPLAPGDVAFVPPDRHHQFRSAQGMELMCLIPKP